MFDLNDLYYFSVVVEKRGFSAAAEAIGVPKGTLSKRIRALEQTLGLRLANRTTRKFSLTEAGAEFHAHCLRVMSEVEKAELSARERLGEPVGRVRMTCPVGAVRLALGDLLPALMAEHPRIDIDLLATDRYVDLVEEGYDLALRVHLDPLQSSSLVARSVAQMQWTLVASPTFFPRGLPEAPQDLDGVVGIQLGRRDSASTWPLLAADGRMATVSFFPRMCSNDAPLARRAAIAGLGVAALPSPMCRADIADGRLVRVLSDWRIPRGTLSLVFPSHRGMTLALRATVNFLVEKLPAYLSD